MLKLAQVNLQWTYSVSFLLFLNFLKVSHMKAPVSCHFNKIMFLTLICLTPNACICIYDDVLLCMHYAYMLRAPIT